MPAAGQRIGLVLDVHTARFSLWCMGRAQTNENAEKILADRPVQSEVPVHMVETNIVTRKCIYDR